MIIAVDFDGTCVSHEYPEIGRAIGAVSVLKELIIEGHELILYTMRSGIGLHNALQWFIENEIRLYGVQFNPTQASWTSSNKCYAQLYIDDAALGCPLEFPMDGKKPYVDWKKVRKILVKNGLLKNK
jgi:hypothetical protein